MRGTTDNPNSDFDIIIASDFRFPGGTSHSIAEEVEAQRVAGYRTGLAHMNGPLIHTLRPFNPLIRAQIEDGAARLIIGHSARARLLVIRHPATAQEALDQLPPLKVEQVVVVANAGPQNIDGRVHYDPVVVTEGIRERFGIDPIWAPIGPLVRSEITPAIEAEHLLERDWVNIIDVEEWFTPRPAPTGDRPVVGRHSRPSAQKWPASARVLRQVYPTDGSWDVRILGGAGPAEDLLGTLPPAWQVLPFGAMPPKEFLAGLDFFVYFHDARWVEAFGRTILEAVASGVPAVLPPHFETLFGSAALYAEPHQVRALVNEYWTNPDRYQAHVAQARESVDARFGHHAHRARLSALLGPATGSASDAPPGGGPPPAELPPSDSPSPPADSPKRPVAAAPDSRILRPSQQPRQRPRILLCSSNGAGMGHLTRLLAYARQLDHEAEPYFLSLSQAVPVVAQFGYPYEYLPSAGALDMPTGVWQEMFVDRLVDALTRIRPEVVVFDGTWPYHGIPRARAARPGSQWVWSRRGMWRPGANVDQLEKSAWFDLVIEPGDFAHEYDRGVTAAAAATRIPPVTLLDREEANDRPAARADLRLPPQGPLALVSLGAGNINDPTHDIGAITMALRNLDVDVCVTLPEIASSSHSSGDVHIVHEFPLAKQYAAFDLVVSASGYNSFQELLRMGVPSLFVPNPQTALDEQARRAQFASDKGWAHMLTEVTVEAAEPLLLDLLEQGREMAAQAIAADPGNGAHEAARIILDLAGARSGRLSA